MTLKEKFEQYPKQEVWEKKNYNAEECVDIADEFAIGFADWVNGEAEYLDYNEKGTAYLYKNNRYRTSELLEIYKKERNL